MKVGFTIANTFEITAKYELVKLDNHKIKFKYTTTNNPLKWVYKLFLVFASEKTVIRFVDRVKEVAESQKM